jgi:hypothetical protein
MHESAEDVDVDLDAMSGIDLDADYGHIDAPDIDPDLLDFDIDLDTITPHTRSTSTSSKSRNNSNRNTNRGTAHEDEEESESDHVTELMRQKSLHAATHPQALPYQLFDERHLGSAEEAATTEGVLVRRKRRVARSKSRANKTLNILGTDGSTEPEPARKKALRKYVFKKIIKVCTIHSCIFVGICFIYSYI